MFVWPKRTMPEEFFGPDTLKLLCEPDPTLAIVVSTAGLYNSRYVFANQSYFSLVGLSWPAISDQNLIGAGAAISSEARDRRLFLLDTTGSYQGEQAVVRHSSGRALDVVIDAWRFMYAGTAFDLEMLRPAAPVAPPRPSIYPASGAPQARLLPAIVLGLSRMRPVERRSFMLRMLMAVSEGAILLRTMMEPHMPAARYGEHLRTRLRAHIDHTRSANGRIYLDFHAYDEEQVETALLEIAGEIWSLRRFARDEWSRTMLGSLVEPYTQPPQGVGLGA